MQQTWLNGKNVTILLKKINKTVTKQNPETEFNKANEDLTVPSRKPRTQTRLRGN